MKQARVLDVQRRQLEEFAAGNNKLLSEANSQAKIAIRRRQGDQQAVKTEMDYERKIQDEQKQARMDGRVMAQNQALSAEMDKEMAENQRKQREIQRICDEAPELKELEKALKIAYLNKERAAQFEEKVLMSQKEQERIQAIEDQMEYDRQYALKHDADQRGAKAAMYDDQRTVLQKQIRDREALLEEAKNQTLRDREMVDNIVKKINHEDHVEAVKRKEMQEATAKMVRDYEVQHLREKAIAAAASKAEEDEINAYNASVAARGAGVMALKQAKQDEADRVLAKIVAETERKRKEEEEFNDLRDMLWAEELEAERTRDTQARKDKSHRMRQEMMTANDVMLRKKAELRIKEAENEARMIGLMKKKFAEDEAKERSEENVKKNAKAHHMVLIEQQAHQRKAMYDEEKQDELHATEEAARREAYRKQVIQEARKRLLAEHSEKLQGFMPRMAMKDV